MKLMIEVIRNRGSVTHGEASVYVNGMKMVTFADDIQMVEKGKPYYGENIGGWASTKSDAEFIKGMLWHPYDETYHYSEPLRKMLDDSAEYEAKRYRYYSVSKPIEIQQLPRGIIGIMDYGHRKYCPEIDGYAYGYAEFEKPLTRTTAGKFGLKMKGVYL